jgi:hypothetical protein
MYWMDNLMSDTILAAIRKFRCDIRTYFSSTDTPHPIKATLFPAEISDLLVTDHVTPASGSTKDWVTEQLAL